MNKEYISPSMEIIIFEEGTVCTDTITVSGGELNPGEIQDIW